MSLRILASALSCNGSMGSEPLVGFKTVQALVEDHDVTVLSSPPTQPPAKARLIECNAGPCVFNEIDSVSLLRFETAQWLAIRGLLAKERFDLAHHVTPSHIDALSLLHHFDMPMLIGPALAAVPPPDSFMETFSKPVGSLTPRFHPARLMRAIANRICQSSLRRKKWLVKARAVIAGVPSVRGAMPDGWKGDICEIPYSGVEHEFFVPPASKPPSKRLRLLFVGRLVPYKGVELILRALGRLGNRLEWEARFIGQSHPNYLSYCEQLARDLAITEKTLFEKAVPRNQLAAAYQNADVFLMPSIETYGIALLEAMSCGLPSVVADLNGPGCILPESAGIKIELHEPEQFIGQFAAAIQSLAANSELRASMGAAARGHVMRKHDWQSIGGQIRAFVRETFGRPDGPSSSSSISNLPSAIQA